MDRAPYLASMMLQVKEMTTMDICVIKEDAPNFRALLKILKCGAKLFLVKRKLLVLKKYSTLTRNDTV